MSLAVVTMATGKFLFQTKTTRIALRAKIKWSSCFENNKNEIVGGEDQGNLCCFITFWWLQSICSSYTSLSYGWTPAAAPALQVSRQ